jgi:ABC-type transport system involved in cytochrome c biogenesis permease subunit
MNGLTYSVATLALTTLLYLIAAVMLCAGLLIRRDSWLIAGRITAGAGVLLHATAIGLRCVELKQAPFTTPAESLSLLAWIVVIAYLGLELIWRLSAAGPFALGASFLLVLVGELLSRNDRIGNATAVLLNNRAISLHVLAMVGAIGAFVLAFCCAALYMVQHRILKSKHGLAWIKRLPPLATVEAASLALVSVGFPLLTLGILSGWIRATIGGALPAGWQTDPKTLLAYLVWAVYAAYLVARLRANWPATRTGYILFVGLFLSLLLFLIPSAAHRFS